MWKSVCPKLPMRVKFITQEYYVKGLGFEVTVDYLMLKKDEVELYFFLFEALDPYQNYGQIYIRVEDIRKIYSDIKVEAHGKLEEKHWGQREFSLLDPDHNLITFGESIHSL
jgi:catechol 2,3-dioxygenase-like lactoylglutathione lyase family enzyme